MLPDIRTVKSVADLPEAAWPIYQYWLAKRGSKRMPARSDIDPTEIPPHLLPSLQLIDVVDDERRYVYRLSGTLEVDVRGRDPRGKSVRERFWGPSAEDAIGCYDCVVSARAPMIDPVPCVVGNHVADFTLFLPLSNDGTGVNMVLVYSAIRELHPRAVMVESHVTIGTRERASDRAKAANAGRQWWWGRWSTR